MRTLTYGTLPTRDEFIAEFLTALPDGLFNITGEPMVPNHDYTPAQLWVLVSSLTGMWENGNDDAGSLASAILGCIGLEWI